MKHYRHTNRASYELLQSERAKAKFQKVSAHFEEISWLATVIRWSEARLGPLLVPPIVCMGVRNGKEIDYWLRMLPRGERWFQWRLNHRRGVQRSDAVLPSFPVRGVELSGSTRPDVWAGNYSRLPATWENQFQIVYSNALDHAFDVVETLTEWSRILRPGGLLVIQTPDAQQDVDPCQTVVGLSPEDLRELCPVLTLLYYQYPSPRTGWQNYILRKPR